LNSNLENLQQKADQKSNELIKFLNECEKQQNELRKKMGIQSNTKNKENTLQNKNIPVEKLHKLSEKEVLELKENVLLEKARNLFKKFEIDKAIKIQREYRSYQRRKELKKQKFAKLVFFLIF